MRIVKYERIFLSMTELNTWEKFEQILEEIERETESLSTLESVNEIQRLLGELKEEVEVAE